jgi:hypothetical protein
MKTCFQILCFQMGQLVPLYNMVGVAMGRLDGFYEIGFGGPWWGCTS